MFAAPESGQALDSLACCRVKADLPTMTCFFYKPLEQDLSVCLKY